MGVAFAIRRKGGYQSFMWHAVPSPVSPGSVPFCRTKPTRKGWEEPAANGILAQDGLFITCPRCMRAVARFERRRIAKEVP